MNPCRPRPATPREAVLREPDCCPVMLSDLRDSLRRLWSCPKCRRQIEHGEGYGAVALARLVRRYGDDEVTTLLSKIRRGIE